MGLLTLGRGAAPIGLDIGSSTFRLAQLRSADDTPLLLSYASMKTGHGLIDEGEILDVPAVSKALADFWRQNKIAEKRVVVGVANQKVVVRVVEMPLMTEAELKSALQFQINDYIPIPAEDAIIDFQILAERQTDNDEKMMDVLIVAARREMIQNTITAIEGAGLRPVVIDVSSLAFARAVLGNQPEPVLPETDSQGATALINISGSLTDIVVIENDMPRFTRISSMGGDAFTEALVQQLGVSFEEAEELKMKIGLPLIVGDENAGEAAAGNGATEGSMGEVTAEAPTGSAPVAETLAAFTIPDPTFDFSGATAGAETEPDAEPGVATEPPGDNEDAPQITDITPGTGVNRYEEAVGTILEQEMSKFIAEIRRSIDYYVVQATNVKHIDKIIVSGGGAKLKNFLPHLRENLQMEVEMAQPLKNVQVKRQLKIENIDDEELSMAICLGLAMRGIEK